MSGIKPLSVIWEQPQVLPNYISTWQKQEQERDSQITNTQFQIFD